MTMIALSGEVGAGKDTVADLMVDALGSRGVQAEIRRFAQPIKDTCYDLGIDPDTREQKEVSQVYVIPARELEQAVRRNFPYLSEKEQFQVIHDVWTKLICGPRYKNSDAGFLFSPRQFQQWLGEAVRNQRQDYYMQTMLAECAKRPDVLFVIPDCRYLNEVGIAHTSLYIERPNNPCRISTTDSSESYQAQLKEQAEFVLLNEHACGEDWKESLEYQVNYLIDQLTARGYLDDVSTTDAA